MWDEDTSVIGNASNGGFFNSTNQGTPQQKAKGARRLQNLVPVCIRQIRDYQEEEFKMFGMPVNMVTIIAILKEYEIQSTKATYQVEDHTGAIKAVWWLDADASFKLNLPCVKEGSYIRIYGSLRVQNGEKFLMVLKMFPVDNINEVTTHLLEVIHARLEAEALSKGSGGLMEKIKRHNPGAELVNSMSVALGGGERVANAFTRLQEKVFNILKSVNNPSGIHRAEIVKEFPPNQSKDVITALEFLTNEGHAYSTIDNDHFKATDSM